MRSSTVSQAQAAVVVSCRRRSCLSITSPKSCGDQRLYGYVLNAILDANRWSKLFGSPALWRDSQSSCIFGTLNPVFFSFEIIALLSYFISLPAMTALIIILWWCAAPVLFYIRKNVVLSVMFVMPATVSQYYYPSRMALRANPLLHMTANINSLLLSLIA